MNPDIVFILFLVLFFVLTWGLVKACEAIAWHKPGDRP